MNPLCESCKELLPLTGNCTAFPGGIPEEILNGEFDHHNPHPKDNGIHYNPKY